jgi:lipopolysaccharide export system permease protein
VVARGIFYRHVLRDVAVATLGVAAVLLVLLLTNQIAFMLRRAADGQVPASLVGELVMLSLRGNATIILPIAVLLGTVLGLGRLYHDSEIAAAHACGIGRGPLYRSAGLMALLAAALCAWIALVSGPQASQRLLDLRADALRTAVTRGLAPGQFRSLGSGVMLTFTAQDPDGTLREVFVQRAAADPQHPGRIEIVTAARARYALSADSTNYTVTMYDGESHAGVPGKGDWRRMRFDEQTVRLPTPNASLPGKPRPDVQPTLALVGSPDPILRAELQWRLSSVLSALVLGVLAVPLSQLRPRQGRYARVIWALMLYSLYAGLLILGRTMLERGQSPAWLGLWWVHACVVAVGIGMVNLPRLRDRLSRWRVERRAPRAAVTA